MTMPSPDLTITIDGSDAYCECYRDFKGVPGLYLCALQAASNSEAWKLVDAVIAKAREFGLPSVWSLVSSPAARAHFESLGFAPDRSSPNRLVLSLEPR